MNIYQGNTFRNDLGGLHFDNDSPKYPFLEFIKYIYVAIAITIPHMATVFHKRPDVKFTKIIDNLRRDKIDRTNQGFIFLGGSLNNRGNSRFLMNEA